MKSTAEMDWIWKPSYMSLQYQGTFRLMSSHKPPPTLWSMIYHLLDRVFRRVRYKMENSNTAPPGEFQLLPQFVWSWKFVIFSSGCPASRAVHLTQFVQVHDWLPVQNLQNQKLDYGLCIKLEMHCERCTVPHGLATKTGIWGWRPKKSWKGWIINKTLTSNWQSLSCISSKTVMIMMVTSPLQDTLPSRAREAAQERPRARIEPT